VARIVCQVLQRPDRVTFIWSEGKASFPPYHLRGGEAAALQRLAAQARSQLAAAASQGNAGLASLQSTGRDLFHAIFPEQAAEIRDWYLGLERAGAVESLEIASDVPGLAPWNVVCSDQGEPWGNAFALAAGRRVNAWRQVGLLDQPSVMLVVDPRLEEMLPEAERARLNDFAAKHDVETVRSKLQLASSLGAQLPEVLYFLGRVSERGLLLGTEVLSLAELRNLLDEGNGDAAGTLIFVNACRADETAPDESFAALLRPLGDGLIAAEQPAPAVEANQFGLTFMSRFVLEGEPLARALQQARLAVGVTGLLYSAFCPGSLRVAIGEQDDDSGLVAPAPLPLPESPYRPLSPYDREEQPLFSGRDQDIAEFAELLDRPETRLALVHGASGVGKSSFLRAGVLPYLEDWSIGFQALRDRSDEEAAAAEAEYPVVSIRASQDLAGQIAEALCAYCDRPLTFATPVGTTARVDLPALLRGGVFEVPGMSEAIQAMPPDGVTAAPPSVAAPPPLPELPDKVSASELWSAMQNDTGLLARLLAALTDRLPHELIILIEQGEELFTQASKPLERRRRRLALQMLARFTEVASQCKIILSLRTEFLGQLLEDFPRDEKLASYLLEDLDDDEIVSAMQLPTSSDPVPFTDEVPQAKYRFVFEQGVVREIVRETHGSIDRRGSMLPTVQAVCALLHGMSIERSDRVIRAGDLQYLLKRGKGLFGLSAYSERMLEKILPSAGDRRAFKAMGEQFIQRHSDGSVGRRLVPVRELQTAWKGYTPLNDVLDGAAVPGGLLEINTLLVGGKEETYVSLAQDGLAQVAAGWAEEGKRQKAVRGRTSDLLWIFIPLVFLAGAVAFFFARQTGGAGPDEGALSSELQRLVKQQKAATEEMLAFPIFVGRVGLADQALRAGNALRARQFLLGQAAKQRGFEWYYLWKNCQPQTHDLLGHLGTIESVALAPDGVLAASASVDGTVRAWNAATGKILATYLGHGSPVFAVAIAADGKTIASGAGDGKIHMWEVSSLKEHALVSKAGKVLGGHKGPVLSLAFAPRDNVLASGGADKLAIVWDLAKDDKKVFKDQGGAIQAVAFAPDGKTLAVAGTDGPVGLWDIAAAKKRHEMKGHGGAVFALAFSPDGKNLASGGIELRESVDIGAIRIWDPETGKPVAGSEGPMPRMRHSQGAFTLGYAADGQTLLSGGKDNLIRLWDPASGALKAAIAGHLGWIRSLASRGHTIVTGSFDQSARVWDARHYQNPAVLEGHKDWVCAVAFSEDDRLLASGSRDGTVKLWDPASGQAIATLDMGAPVQSVAFTPGKGVTRLAAGTWADAGKSEVRIWDVESVKGQWKTKELHRFKELKGIAAVAFSADAATLAAGGEDRTIRIWDGASGKPGTIIKGHPGTIRCLAFAPENDTLASGGEDRLLIFWDWKSGKPVTAPIPAHNAAVTALSFFTAGPGTTVLASAGDDQGIDLWKMDEPKQKHRGTFRGHSGGLLALAASPRGDIIASAGWDTTIKLWTALRPGSEERFTFTGHTGPVRGLAFSGNARILASGSHDRTIRLWHAAAPPRQKHE